MVQVPALKPRQALLPWDPDVRADRRARIEDPFMFAAVKTVELSFQSDPGSNIDVDT